MATDIHSMNRTIRAVLDVRYSFAAAYSLQIYEWISSFEDEIVFIHYGPWTSVRIAYLLCRYYPLLFWPALIWAYSLNHDPLFCLKVVRPVHALLAPYQFFSQAVMFMRAYAFSGRNKAVFVMLSITYTLLVGIDIWLFCTHVSSPSMEKYGLYINLVGGTGCFPDYSAKLMGLRMGMAMLAALLMDLLTLGIVVLFCFCRDSSRSPLARYFVKQGLSSFAFVCGVNVLGILLYFHMQTGIGLPFILMVSNLLACRLILQLRHRAARTDTEIYRENSLLVMNALGGTETKSDAWAVAD